jgi:L-ascorbate metabolism protein UlaG (beta-lactamase superfamily)
MYLLLILIALLFLSGFIILNLPVFGKLPSGERLEKIMRLPNYKNGALENESATPMLPAEVSYWEMFRKMIKGNKNGTPKSPLPHIKPDFSPSEELKISWFGHSSYLIQIEGKNILVDPVFSERPSPFQFIGTKRFDGTDFVGPGDFPVLDLVLITHDHYDHLDYDSIVKLKAKTNLFITSLGVGSHLEHWGVDPKKIVELSHNEQFSVFNFTFTALPARHFSGRMLKRNQTVWSSFVLQTSKNRLYLGGDSGFDEHFRRIGEAFGPFDLAILECGQYNKMWPLIHLFPEELVTAAELLKAERVMPVHWGKYRLALHDWDDPIIRLSIAAKVSNLELVTPKLGEAYFLGNKMNEEWWKTV